MNQYSARSIFHKVTLMAMMKSAFILTAFVLACSFESSEVFADIITLPPGLNPGDQYRLVFVTEGGRNAASSNIDDYNGFVTTQASQNAALLSLGTTWKAIASTTSIDARDNTETDPNISAGVPIFRLDGLRVADTNADLWDSSLDNSISIDQNGVTHDVTVWTGTTEDGVEHQWGALGHGYETGGRSGLVNGGWMYSYDGRQTLEEFRLYAMSGVLTAVPEPSSLLLVGLGACVLCVATIRRRKEA